MGEKNKKVQKNFLPYKTDWYPTIDSSVNPRQFVYLTSLQFEPSLLENIQYIKASSLLKESHSAFSQETMHQAYTNLQSFYQQEREAEVQFINERLKLNYDPNTISIKQLIDSLNQLLNFESTYKENVKRIIEPQEQRSKKLEYLYYTTRFTLPAKINQVLESKILPLLKKSLHRLNDSSLYEEIELILKDTILNTLREQYASEKMPDENKPYNEFMDMIKNLSNQSQLINDLLKVYGVDQAQIKNKIQSDVAAFDRKAQGILKARGGKGIGGFAFESFVEAIAREVTKGLQGKVISTGSLGNMKADQIFVYDLDIDEDRLKKIIEDGDADEYSRRIKNIQAMEVMFEQLKQAKGDIVFVSDKSYDFTREGFEGFTAESPSLRVAAKVLEKANVNSELIEHLVFIAANSGSDRVNGNNTEDIRRFFASAIGNFMFDDVLISQELAEEIQGIHRLHVFNLNNIYVPLSVLLKGLYDALIQANKDYKNIVNVGISTGEVGYKEQKDGLSKQDWTSLYNTVLTKTKFHIHFFKNFADFIAQSLK